MSKEQDDLLNTLLEELPEVVHKPNAALPRITDPRSLFEVSVAATVVEVTPSFDGALKIYDQSLHRGSSEVCITQILNGVRSTLLRSPVVVYRNNPINSLGFKNTKED